MMIRRNGQRMARMVQSITSRINVISLTVLKCSTRIVNELRVRGLGSATRLGVDGSPLPHSSVVTDTGGLGTHKDRKIASDRLTTSQPFIVSPPR